MSRPLRCAVYTRKSSEEGLDMAFNSLRAQREAGLDYIKSQKHQGWSALSNEYDDGGYSGGTMQRPALQRLLADIDAGRIDIVVVYKVDRLSRSLADFARLMQRFDERGVSFVSVTQQFSTTTSMGRLTLNMLLSFAQFEREVAGERIRDKIAATMKKGIRVSGAVPTGYRRGRQGEPPGLHVEPAEAKIVCEIFDGYVELRSLVALAQRMARLGRTTPRRTSKAGRVRGGRPYSTSALYGILTNPVYIGKVTHTRRLPGANGGRGQVRTDVYDGVHEPIVPRNLWDRVHALMERSQRETNARWTHSHLLKGKIRTAGGAAMSPSAVHRKTDNKGRPTERDRHIGYYVSQKAIKHGYAACPVKSVNAAHIDDVVRGLIFDYMSLRGLQTVFEDPSVRDATLRELVRQVVVAPERLTIELETARLDSCTPVLSASRSTLPRVCPLSPVVEHRDGAVALSLAIEIKRLDGRRMLLAPDGQDLLARSPSGGTPTPDPTIVRSIGLAYAALRAIATDGLTVAAAGQALGVPRSTLTYVLPLTQLGPEILRSALEGTLPPRMNVKRLRAIARHLDWQRQLEELQGRERSN
ncbi:MAG: recombinase family protein [Planctomycetota bacterium]|nr:recombinase family protein [Planctomycetota bacterium]